MSTNVRPDLRREELLALARSDPKRLLQIWRDAGGVPPTMQREGELDLENVVVPAILKLENAGHEAPRR